MDFGSYQNDVDVNKLSYDEIKFHYSQLKIILTQVTEEFSQTSSKVSDILKQYSSTIDSNLLSLLSSTFLSFKNSIHDIISKHSDNQTNSLENQIIALEKEKREWQKKEKQGYEMLQSLKKSVMDYEEEKKKMGKRKTTRL